jgi:hypothetical protein
MKSTIAVVLIFWCAVQLLHAQPKKQWAKDATLSFTQKCATFDRSTKFPVYGSSSHRPPANLDSGSVQKWMRLTVIEASKKETAWRLDVNYDTRNNQGHEHLEWERTATMNVLGTFNPLLDSLYMPVTSGGACGGSVRKMALPEYGGRVVELWRIFPPPRLWQAKAGEYWGDQSYGGIFVGDPLGLDQLMRYTMTYTCRGIIDTLGMKTMALQWKLIASSVKATIHTGESCEGEFTVWASAAGTSYFSPEDGLLLLSLSEEEVNLEAASGLINSYLNVSSEVRRDGVAVPAARAGTGD